MIIACCIIGFYLATKIYEHTRKRRINEIKEQYEYNSYEDKNINYENNSKNEIVLEMPSKQQQWNNNCNPEKLFFFIYYY